MANVHYNKTPSDIPIIALGASAGGLEGFKIFLKTLPPSCHAAFVLIQHLAPRSSSVLSEILKPYTKMPIKELENSLAIEPGNIYVVKPNALVSLKNNFFEIHEALGTQNRYTPINFFLNSLAHEKHEYAIGVILSGTGSDGKDGMLALKAEGGLTIVQDPQEAKFGEMPESSIATNVIDFIIPLKDIFPRISKYLELLQQNYQVSLPDENNQKKTIDSILEILNNYKKNNFYFYKPATLVRRIYRRMTIKQINEIELYYEFLKSNEEEVVALYNTLLISVTSFFRDPKSFKTLNDLVVKKIVSTKTDDPIRIWIVGCATGEEAYSLGILFLEAQKKFGQTRDLQIFATDIDHRALEIARAGKYDTSIQDQLSKAHLDKYFFLEGNYYIVKKHLRKVILFAEQNFLTEAPFSKLDLITCRNLLIYIKAQIQEKVLTLFNFSLKRKGYLFLGSSETIGNCSEIFKPLSKIHRIYQTLSGPSRREVLFPLSLKEDTTIPHNEKAFVSHQIPLGEKLRNKLLELYSPAAALIKENGIVIYFSGPITRYLGLAQGEPTYDILSLAKNGLRAKIRSALYKLIKEKKTVEVQNVIIHEEDKQFRIKVTLHPFNQEDSNYVLITFEDETLVEEGEVVYEYEENQIIQQLEKELKDTRSDLQSTIEEMETSNEELKTANEEVTSTNEELQSTVEELETSKEELNSLNEELNIVNRTLEEKVYQGQLAKTDFINLLNSTDIATLFLDRKGNIRHFTSSIQKFMNVRHHDIGRPIFDITLKFKEPFFLKDILKSLKTNQILEREVSVQENFYLRRNLPYINKEGKINGIIITFSDITTLKKRKDKLKELSKKLENRVEERTIALQNSEARFRGLLENFIYPITIKDNEGRFLLVNAALEELLGYDKKDIIGKKLSEVVPDIKNDSAVHKEVQEKGVAKKFYQEIKIKDKNHYFKVIKYPLIDEGNMVHSIGDIFIDVTDIINTQKTLKNEIKNHKLIQKTLLKSETELLKAKEETLKLYKSKTEFVAMMGHEIRTPMTALIGILEILGEGEDLSIDKKKVFLTAAKESGAELQRIINNFLDFSKIEVPELSIKKVIFNLETLVKEVCHLFEAAALNKAIKLKCVIDINHPSYVESDPSYIKSILNNLISNALKFTEKGSIIVRLAEANGKYECSVKDSGCGIYKHDLKKIFQPFYQSKTLSSSTYKGSGLGLTICQRLTNLLNGTIWCESTRGKGTTFYVDLPLKWVDSKLNPLKTTPDLKLKEPLKILLIEDHKTNHEIVKEMLLRLNCQVSSAYTAHEALKLLSEITVDVLLIDYHLPDMSGREVFLKLQKQGNKIPTIIFSAGVNTFDSKELLKLGIKDVLLKPVLLHELYDSLKKAVYKG